MLQQNQNHELLEQVILRAEEIAQQTQKVVDQIKDSMDSIQNPLTSAEIAALWTQYMNETAGLCINRFMLEHIQDFETKALFEYSLNLGVKHIEKIKTFLLNDGFLIPLGFTSSDVSCEAPRLFSDVFCIHYLNIMSLHGCHGYSGAITTSTREDIRKYFTECNESAVELCNLTKDTLLKKGIYFKPPALVPPNNIKMVKTDNFISGWFHETRPLSCIEIAAIVFNLKKSIMAKALAVAFGQVAESKKVREFCSKAVQTKESHIDMFSKLLDNDNLPSPPSLVSEITDSKIPPFSDKLMMFFVGFLFSSAIVYYGSGLASSPRKDIAAKYLSAIGGDINIEEDWLKIMIENSWLEQPPLAPDRKKVSS